MRMEQRPKWMTGGGGVVLRDHHGAFRGGAALCFPGAGHPQFAELLAAKSAVQMAITMDVQWLHIELDCQEVVAMLQGEGRNLSSFGPVVEETKELLRTRQEFKISWVRRTAKCAAHGLAREGLCNDSTIYFCFEL